MIIFPLLFLNIAKANLTLDRKSPDIYKSIQGKTLKNYKNLIFEIKEENKNIKSLKRGISRRSNRNALFRLF